MNQKFENTDLTANMEDYIETISILAENSKVVRVKDIAAKLNIKMPSVSAALSKLKEKGLIEYEKYGYIELTPLGKNEAAKVYNRHKILHYFLKDILGVSNSTADDEACKLEHYLSPETCQKINKLNIFFSSDKIENQNCIEKIKSFLNS